MSLDDIVAQVLGLEVSALRKLDASTKAVIAQNKGATPNLPATAGALDGAVAADVVSFRDVVRVAAAKQLAAVTGLAVLPSGTIDTERGTKAAAYYVKAWTHAMPTAYGGGGGMSGGGGSSDSWDDAIELARVDALPSLARVAAFEVWDAWNDEHRRNAESLPGHIWSVQWIAFLDTHTCKVCKALHLKFADANGQFVVGDPPTVQVDPPAHGGCRCFLKFDVVGTLPAKAQRGPPRSPHKATMTYAIDSIGHAQRDANDIVRRSDALHVRAIRSESRECDFIASTDTLDSFDEVVDQGSWDLTRFLKNPVILFQHDRWALPLGQATRCEVVNGQLEITVKFASAEANPEAEKVWRLVQEKALRAVSVGFKPMNSKWEMRNGRDTYVLYDCSLRECSIVTVPANEDCLAQMKAEALERAEPEMRERVRSAMAGRAAPLATKTTTELSAPSPSTHDDSPAKGDTEKDQMDLKEATEKLETTTKALADATSREKAASDKLAELETKTAGLEAANATLTKEHTKAAEDRDAAVARAAKAEGELIALEVEALVGKKIAPTEKADFIKLRTDSPELFASMVAKRPDMKLGEPVIAGKADADAAAHAGAPAPAGAPASNIWTD